MGKSNAPSKTSSTANKTTDTTNKTTATTDTTSTPSNSFVSPVTGSLTAIYAATDTVYQWRTKLLMLGQFTQQVSALPKIGPEQRPITEAALRLLNRSPDIVQATGITPAYTTSLMAHRDAAAQVSSSCASQGAFINGGFLLLSGAADNLNIQVLDTANGMVADLTLPWARRSDIRDLWKQANLYDTLPAQKIATTKAARKKKKAATAKGEATATTTSQVTKAQGLIRAGADKEVTAPQTALTIPGAPRKR